MTANIYIDESGHTGPDLLNIEQPFFTLAASWMGDSDYEQLSKIIPNGTAGKEYKFNSLRKRKSHPKILSDLIDFLAERSHLFCVYVVDKQSILIEKFVLDCIEPCFFEMGYDMSEKGGVRSYANLLDTCLPAFMGDPWYTKFLALYQRFYREKTTQSLSQLVDHCCCLSEDALELLCPFVSAPQLALAEVHHPAYKTQIFDPIVHGLIVHIRHVFSISEMNILYDQTKATTIPELRFTLEALHNYREPVKVSDVCTVHPDIKIKSVDACDSIEVPLIQISDLIAGLYTYCCRKALDDPDDALFNQLFKNCGEDNFIHKLRSHAVTPEELGTTDSNSSISMHAFQSSENKGAK
jgi:hypothetical protein